MVGHPRQLAGGNRASTRRGLALLVAIVALAIIHIAVVGAVISGESEAQVSAFRVETVRAFYAAESGAMIAIRSNSDGLNVPGAGSTQAVGSATVTFVQVPGAGTDGTVIVEGRCGDAARRLSIAVSGS